MVMPRIGVFVVESVVLSFQCTMIPAMVAAAIESLFMCFGVIVSHIAVKTAMLTVIRLMLRVVGLSRSDEGRQSKNGGGRG